MDIVNLNFREESVHINRKEITDLIIDDWFLSNILQMDFKDGLPKKLDINEDKNTAMSLIESLRYNSLIVLPNVSLDYMLSLSYKWCLPQYINKMIIDRINYNVNINRIEENLGDNMFDFIDTAMTFKCENCRGGFKISENTSESCEYHSGTINYGLEIYICCGQKMTGPPKPCRKSYHVMCRDDMRFYLEAKKKYRKEILQKNINDEEENDIK